MSSYAQLRKQLAKTLAKYPPKPKPAEETPIPSLYEFVKMAWHVVEPGRAFVDGNHIEALCKHLEAVTYGTIKRLLVNMPPRHAKSTIISVIWPVWSWLVDPTTRFLCASYAKALARRDNRKSRQVIQSNWFQERWGYRFAFSKDQNAVDKYENTVKGYRQAVSVGSSTTGEGFDIGIIDDLHNIDEKTSDVKRERALDWFTSTWGTRLNDPEKSAQVVVGQRIHAEDVSGYILSGESGEEWVHLNLPAEYEESNPSRSLVNGEVFWEDWRELEGDLLWPERFTQKILDGQKKKQGAMGYAALFQQRPVPAGGGQFKQEWFRYFLDQIDWFTLDNKHVAKRDCDIITTVDLAISLKQTADYTVISTWAITPDNDILLLDRVRGRFDNPTQVKQLLLCNTRHRPEYFLIETVAYQLAIIHQARNQGLPAQEFRPRGDKPTRAVTAAVMYEGAKVWHPYGTDWLPEWESELVQFPRGAKDDQVDTVSMICGYVADNAGNSIEPLDQEAKRIILDMQNSWMAR